MQRFCKYKFLHFIFYFIYTSIREVLSQINELILPWVRAFEIIEFPEKSEDFYKDSFTTIIFNKGYHVSTVRLYGEKN